jgi:hypothetical protein
MSMTENRFSLQSYQALEQRIHKSDLDALLARWEFGAQLLKERRANGGKQLPHGRLEEICNDLNLSGAEINNRMQFAAEYQKEKVPNALETFHSWYQIVRQGLGRRALTPEAHQPKWASEVDRLLLDLANCAATPRALRELVSDMTPEQLAEARQVSRRLRYEVDVLERDIAAVGDKPRTARDAVDDEASAKVPARRARPGNHVHAHSRRRVQEHALNRSSSVA